MANKITQEEYLKNRIKIEKDIEIWDTYIHERIKPDELISKLNRLKEEILNNGLEADDCSMYLDISHFDGGETIDLHWDQYETIDEYQKRLQNEEIARMNKFNSLKLNIENNFKDACNIIEMIKLRKNN